jgi:hypothetical protein
VTPATPLLGSYRPSGRRAVTQEKGVTKAAIENAADRIAARGQRPYPSNILKFFGYQIEDVVGPPT